MGGGGGWVNRNEGEESSLDVLLFLAFSVIALHCPGSDSIFSVFVCVGFSLLNISLSHCWIVEGCTQIYYTL